MLSFMCSLQADHHHLLASSASAMGFHQEGEMKQWLSFFFHCVSNSAVGNFPSSLFINTGRLFLIKRKKKSATPLQSIYLLLSMNSQLNFSLFLCVSIKRPIRQLLLLLSRFSRVRLCATPETADYQPPPSLGFSRQEHWSGLPFPSSPIRLDGTYTGEGNGTPLQYSCLEHPIDRGAWQAAVHGVAKSWARLSDFTFSFHFHALEEDMATHSSVLAWRIPGTGEPGGLPSTGLHRVRHN